MKQIDFSQFKYRFVEEALKLLESLEYDTLRLEKDNAGGGFVDGIMRVMHTLKGVSSMYGFHQIEVLTHQLESMYSAFQTGEIDQSDEINDITLVAIDHLRCLLTDETGSSTENIETHNKLLKRIYKLIGESANQAPVTIVKTHEEAQRKMQSWYIMLTINDSIILRGVKLLRIFRDLSALGQYEIVKHSYSTTDEKTEEIWGVYLVTDANVDQIEDVFLLIPDNCKITPVSNCNIFDENYYLEGCQSNETREISLFDSITSISQQISNEAANHDTDLVPDVSFLDGIIAITQQNNNSISNNETNAIQIDNKEYIKSKSQRISVDAQKLDELMYLVSELIINKERLVVATTNELYDRLPTITEQLDKLSKRFRDITLDIRLVPIEDLVLRFKRLVRDLSKGLNKQVELITDLQGHSSTFPLRLELRHSIGSDLRHDDPTRLCP